MNIDDVDPHRLYCLSDDELNEYLATTAKERRIRGAAVQAQIDAAKDSHLAERLETIRVLWRQPDVLALWGVPYDMRKGQSPRDVWEGRRAPFNGISLRAPGPSDGWIWLGSPGWWGPYPAGSSERAAIESFLAKLPESTIPNRPYEWLRIDGEP